MPRQFHIVCLIASCLLLAAGVAGFCQDCHCTHESGDNDSITFANVLPWPGASCGHGTIDPAGDVDAWSLRVDRPARVGIGVLQSGDTTISLYNEYGALLAEESGGPARTMFEIVLLEGTYYITVRARTAQTVEHYDIFVDTLGDVDLPCLPEEESNDDASLADLLRAEQGVDCRSGEISPWNDVDFYGFELPGTYGVEIEVFEGSWDADLRLYNAQGVLLAEGTTSQEHSRWSGLIKQILPAGVYFVSLTGHNALTSPVSYTVRLSVWDVPGEQTPPRDAPPWGWLISGRGVILSEWGSIDKPCLDDYSLGAGLCDKDTYEFTLEAGGMIALALIDEPGAWITAHIYNSAGERILSKYGNEGSIYSTWHVAMAGNYRVEVVPLKRLDHSQYELHVVYSVWGNERLEELYGAAFRDLPWVPSS